MPMNTRTTTARTILTGAETEAELLEILDRVLQRAARGDAQAVLTVTLAFGPTLLAEARKALGPVYQQDAGDVVQDFTLALLEGDALRFPAIRGAALPWMKRTVRRLAREHLEGRGRDLGDAG